MTSAGIRYSNIEPGPRDQRRATTDRRQRPAEPEPVVGRDVALGDRKEAGQPGLGGEQVVVARIQRAVADPEPDREQLAGRVEQEAEVHLAEQLIGLVGDRPEPSNQRCGGAAIRRQRRPTADRTARRSSGRSAAWRDRSKHREVANVAGSRPAASPRPTSSARCPAPSPALGDERRGDVGQRACRRGELAEVGRPGLRSRGRGVAGRLRGRSRASSRCRWVRVWLRPVVADRAGRRSRQRRARRRCRRAPQRPGAAGRSSAGRRWRA